MVYANAVVTCQFFMLGKRSLGLLVTKTIPTAAHTAKFTKTSVTMMAIAEKGSFWRYGVRAWYNEALSEIFLRNEGLVCGLLERDARCGLVIFKARKRSSSSMTFDGEDGSEQRKRRKIMIGVEEDPVTK